MAGNCSVCFHRMRVQIDRWMREDQNFAPILREIREAAKKDASIQIYSDKGPLKRHRENCLKLPTLLSSSGGGEGKFHGEQEAEQERSEVSSGQLAERARVILDGRLRELSAEKLHALVIEGMRLERVKLGGRAKERDDEDEEGEVDKEAAAEMARSRTS